jgi:hypothetical protein
LSSITLEFKLKSFLTTLVNCSSDAAMNVAPPIVVDDFISHVHRLNYANGARLREFVTVNQWPDTTCSNIDVSIGHEMDLVMTQHDLPVSLLPFDPPIQSDQLAYTFLSGEIR